MDNKNYLLEVKMMRRPSRTSGIPQIHSVIYAFTTWRVVHDLVIISPLEVKEPGCDLVAKHHEKISWSGEPGDMMPPEAAHVSPFPLYSPKKVPVSDYVIRTN